MGAGRPDGNRDDKIGGWTIPEWAGVNLHDPPHLIERHEFQNLVNARWNGKQIVPRPGQRKFMADVIGGDDISFLWGAYGGVLQHGGVGGVGFKDTPNDEAPASFPFGGTSFVADVDGYSMVADASGYTFLYVLIGVKDGEGDFRLVRVYRLAKTYPAAANLYVSYAGSQGSTASLGMVVYDLSTGSHTVLANGSTTFWADYVVANGVLIGEIPVDPTLFDIERARVNYASGGSVWVSITQTQVAPVTGTTRIYEIDARTGDVTLVKTYAVPVFLSRRFFNLSSSLYALMTSPSAFSDSELWITRVPDFSGEVKIADDTDAGPGGFRLGTGAQACPPSDLNFLPSFFDPVYGGAFYFVGTRTRNPGPGSDAILLKVTSGLVVQPDIPIDSPTADGAYFGVRGDAGANLYVIYNKAGTQISRYNGAVFTALGAYPVAASGSPLGLLVQNGGDLSSDDRLYGRGDVASNRHVWRSNASDFQTFSGFGSLVPGGHLYYDQMEIVL